MTYNVHGCVGLDLRLDPERTASLIERFSPDVVALQELYVGHERSGGLDQAAWLAARLDMDFVFGSARESDTGGRYGNAVLSRHKLRLVRAESLPQSMPRLERRAALRVGIETSWGELDVVNTHLGLEPSERRLQTHALVADWLSHVDATSLSVLCGDFNATPLSAVYAAVTALMRDAQRSNRFTRLTRATWPSFAPFLRLDHVFVSPALGVTSCVVPRGRGQRMASDHLPVIADLTLARP
jgi:endonuclease/exonuclease/phosphatase family metal-dependent hydrolase